MLADRKAGHFLEEPLSSTSDLDIFGSPEEAFMPHEVLCGRFEILSLLGEGGMGQVYEALDLELKESVAIKTIRGDIVGIPGTLERFKREVFATRKVTHPNVCRTFDIERHTTMRGNVPHTITFLTMELLRGQTLAERLRLSESLELDDVRVMAKQLADALQAAHQAGIIHCDLKPANVFLTIGNFGPRAVVTDFGIARLIQQTDDGDLVARRAPERTLQFTATARAGTPRYMAPEQQGCGACTPASDLYSLGLLLFEALTGELPSRHQDLACQIDLWLQARSGLAACKAEANAHSMWRALLTGCLQKEPEKRFNDASQVLQLLEAREERYSPSTEWTGWRRGRFWMLVASMMALLAVAATVGRTWTLGTANVGRKPSVAVLAFANIPGDTASQSVSNVVVADLTSELAQVNGLRVPSQSLILNSDTAAHFAETGRRLRVDTLLQGSLERVADGFVEKVELIDTQTGAQLWSRNYHRAQAELGTLQQDIAEEVAFRLRSHGGAGSTAAAVHVMPPAAKAMYDRGQEALAEHTRAGFEKAIVAFQQTIDADPQSAAAYAAQADVYIKMASNFNRPEAPLTLLANAEKAARRALQVNSNSAPAYCSLAQIELLRDYEWDAAEENFKRALELDPTYLRGHMLYATLLLTAEGRFAEARAQFAYASSNFPKKLDTALLEVTGAYYARQFQTSLEQGHQIREHAPTHEATAEIMALDYIAEGRPKEAMALLYSLPPATGDAQASRIALLGLVYAQQGRRDKARGVLRQIESSITAGSEQNLQIASLAAAVGDSSKAMKYLERAYTRRQMSLLFVEVDPLMDPLRSNARFHNFLTKLHRNQPVRLTNTR
ncbi:Serine/threonine protein kinase [Granulicella sibirica]|uniref:Serine/threonine protein kinase n=1 Tax=Granulicella sibirica TaxID=2479048 RepID=A0A4Q0T0I5_9BACT|nr:Serine/threonine protein kinase [Granulicella sibirica]